MYWSKYNRIYEISEKESVVFNYAWNKSLLVVNELVDLIKRNINSIDSIRDVHPTFFKALLVNNMAVPDFKDEVLAVKKHILSELYNNEVLRLTINPTLDCNLNCWYCYEKHDKNAYMSERILLSLVHLVRYQVSKGVRQVQLSFFGGEPLLGFYKRAFPIIESVNRICMERGHWLEIAFYNKWGLVVP